MKQNYKNRRKAKYSKPAAQTEPKKEYKNLVSELREKGSIPVTFVFETPRIKFIEENPNGEFYRKKTTQILNITDAVLKGQKSVKRTSDQIVDIIKSISQDMRATSFHF